MASGRFAFAVHPTDISFVHRRWPVTGWVPDRWTERALSLKRPFAISRIRGVQSPHSTAEGLFVAIPLTPRMWRELPEEFLIRRVVQACEIAARRGARIIGLGAYSAIPGDAGREIARRSPIPVTTGNSYTVAAALEGAREGARLMGVDMETAQIAVVGAAGSIGSCCVRILARQCRNITLVGRRPEPLKALSDRVWADNGALCRVSTDIRSVLPQADVVIAVSSAADAIIEPGALKPGAVVCDVAIPRDVDRLVAETRNDVLVVDGGLIAVPGDLQLGYDVRLPDGVVWACLAETMLLALEERYEPFTLGRNLTLAQVDEIQRLANRHGFTLAHPRSFHRALTPEQIAEVRRNAKRYQQEWSDC